MHKITAPVKGYSGRVAGVHFVDGVGETDNENAIAYFRRHKYGVEEVAQADEQVDETPAAEVPEVTPPAPPFAPNRGSSKAEWVAYVTGPNAGEKALTEAEANDRTRDQLAEHVLGPKEAQA